MQCIYEGNLSIEFDKTIFQDFAGCARMQAEAPQMRFSAPQICWRNGLCMHSGRGGKAPTKKQMSNSNKKQGREGRRKEGVREQPQPNPNKQKPPLPECMHNPLRTAYLRGTETHLGSLCLHSNAPCKILKKSFVKLYLKIPLLAALQSISLHPSTLERWGRGLRAQFPPHPAPPKE